MITFRIEQTGLKFQGVEVSHDGSMFVTDGFATTETAQVWLDGCLRMLGQGDADAFAE
jgi:hypothetical protein